MLYYYLGEGCNGMPDLNWDVVLVLLRFRVSQSAFRISKHANQRMSERNVSKADVTHCLMSGKIVESQNHGWDTKYLIKGNRQNGAPFYLVMASSEKKID